MNPGGLSKGRAKYTRCSYTITECKVAVVTLVRAGEVATPTLGSIIRHATFRIGPHGMVLTWNAAATKVTGWRPDEIIGQDYGILHADDALPAQRGATDMSHRELLAAAESGRFEQQCWLVRPNGTRIWSNLAVSSMKDRQGRLRGFDAVVQDLTDRLLVDDLFAVLDATPEAILSIDERGVVTFANRAGRRLFGYTGEMRSIPVWQLLPALEREKLVFAPMKDQVRDLSWPEPRLTVQGLELDAVREDGTSFLAEISLSSVQSPRGRTVTVTVRPLPERLDSSLGAPDSLSVHRLGAVFDDSAVGRLEASVGSVVLRANRALESMLGYSSGALVGSAWAQVVHPADRAGLAVDVDSLVSGAAGYCEAERRLIRRDGTEMPGLLAATVVRDRAGRPTHLVGVVLDNSEPLRARHHLLQLATQAARF